MTRGLGPLRSMDAVADLRSVLLMVKGGGGITEESEGIKTRGEGIKHTGKGVMAKSERRIRSGIGKAAVTTTTAACTSENRAARAPSWLHTHCHR